jgi:hypothetical protein
MYQIFRLIYSVLERLYLKNGFNLGNDGERIKLMKKSGQLCLIDFGCQRMVLYLVSK